MNATLSLDDLKDLGADHLAPEEVAALYREAFEKFGTQSLWSRRRSEQPTIAQAIVLAEILRREGDMKTFRFAARIEAACRAAL
jgi:hypothetical protein